MLGLVGRVGIATTTKPGITKPDITSVRRLVVALFVGLVHSTQPTPQQSHPVITSAIVANRRNENCKCT